MDNDTSEVDSLTNAIEDKNNEIKQLNVDVFMLMESLKRLKQEKEVVKRSLEKTKEGLNSTHNELDNKLKSLETLLNHEDAEFQRNFDEKRKAISKEKDAELEIQRKRLEEAENELKRHEDLKLKMEEYEREMAALRESNEKQDRKLKKIKYDFMLKMAIENQKIQHENDKNFQEEMYKDKEDAERQIKKLGIEIHENNTQMNEKSILQRYEIDKIKKQKEEIIKLNKSYKRDMMLNAETMEEYSKRQQNQNKKIKLLKSKIQILEKSLSQIVQDFEKEKTLIKKQNEEILTNQQNELEHLREDLQQKNKEFRMLRSLSSVIIEQRSDIEQFFLEALEQIKEEIRKKVAEEKKLSRFRLPGQTMGGTAGSMGQTVGSQDQTKSYADKVDLNDLDWEDRERVLRLLFSKINAGVHPSRHWKDVEAEGEDSQDLDQLE